MIVFMLTIVYAGMFTGTFIKLREYELNVFLSVTLSFVSHIPIVMTLGVAAVNVALQEFAKREIIRGLFAFPVSFIMYADAIDAIGEAFAKKTYRKYETPLMRNLYFRMREIVSKGVVNI